MTRVEAFIIENQAKIMAALAMLLAAEGEHQASSESFKAAELCLDQIAEWELGVAAPKGHR